MSIVYLGLGSNLGKREENIEKAISLLREAGLRILSVSSIIETNPVGGPENQGKYLNGVLKASIEIDPQALLLKINEIESLLGRIRTERNGPRTIDIDILIFDNIKIKSKDLTIPHPRMMERDFVINPLLEIDPDALKNLKHANN